MKVTGIIVFIAAVSMMHFKWTLAAEERFCFEEALPEKILVNGLFEGNTNHSVGIMIISPSGADVYKDVTSIIFPFSFATFDAGNYKFCMHNFEHAPQKIKLRIDIGIEAKNYTTFTSKPDLRELDFDVKKLEDMTDQLHNDLVYLYQKANVVANVNAGTSNKIIFFGVMTIMLLIISTALQICSIRRFFLQKKIA